MLVEKAKVDYALAKSTEEAYEKMSRQQMLMVTSAVQAQTEGINLSRKTLEYNLKNGPALEAANGCQAGITRDKTGLTIADELGVLQNVLSGGLEAQEDPARTAAREALANAQKASESAARQADSLPEIAYGLSLIHI